MTNLSVVLKKLFYRKNYSIYAIKTSANRNALKLFHHNRSALNVVSMLKQELTLF